MPEEQLLTFNMEETLNRVTSIVDEGRFNGELEGQLQTLINSLTMIQAAARRPVTDKSEKLLLHRLLNVAYDAKFVLDEFANEFENEILPKEQKKGNELDFISLRNSVTLRLSMDRKVKKFTDAINEIWEDFKKNKEIWEDTAGSGLGFTSLQHENTDQESAVDTVEAEKLNGAMKMEIQSCVESVEQGGPDIMEDDLVLNKEDENEKLLQTTGSLSTHRLRPSSQSAVVTDGTMEMESGTNTHSNPSQENAGSSCKSSAVDTVEAEKLNGAMKMEIQSCVESDQGRPDRNLFIGDGAGPVHLANSPQQKLGYTKLGSQPEGMDDESIPHHLHPIRKSAVDTGGTMNTETRRNTRSNPSLGNARSSCKSKTAEWALPVTSVVLEATSAIFEQLGYPLTSMVMAFVALLLSILDLILKARERGITCDGRGLLPCFCRQSSQDRKPFASLVHYLGLAGALWQCSFTTVGYHYTHQKLVNPIKLCLLPFILALCVLISKVVKSSQHARLDSNAD